MKKWINSNWFYLAGCILGGIAGYLYWMKVGCASGTCLITSKPLNSTVYGAVMGALFLGMFKMNRRKPVA